MLHDLKPVSEPDGDLQLMIGHAALVRGGGNAVVITDRADVLEGPVSSDGSVEPGAEEFIPADRSDPEVRRAINLLYRRLVPDPGDALSNGARVLDVTHTRNHLAIVAAKFQGKYATWTLNLQTGGAGHGNYFQEPREPFWADYRERIESEPTFSVVADSVGRFL
jgi:hypothetical protein